MSWNHQPQQHQQQNHPAVGRHPPPPPQAHPWVRDPIQVLMGPPLPPGTLHPLLPARGPAAPEDPRGRDLLWEQTPPLPPLPPTTTPTTGAFGRCSETQHYRTAPHSLASPPASSYPTTLFSSAPTRPESTHTAAAATVATAGQATLVAPSQAAAGGRIACTAMSVTLAMVHCVGGRLHGANGGGGGGGGTFAAAMCAGARLDWLVRRRDCGVRCVRRWIRQTCARHAAALLERHAAAMHAAADAGLFFLPPDDMQRAVAQQAPLFTRGAAAVVRAVTVAAATIMHHASQQLESGQLFEASSAGDAGEFLETHDVLRAAVDMYMAPRGVVFDWPYEGVEVLVDAALAEHVKRLYALAVLNSLGAVVTEDEFDRMTAGVRVYYNDPAVYAAGVRTPSPDAVRRALAPSPELLALYEMGTARLAPLLIALLSRPTAVMSRRVHRETVAAFAAFGGDDAADVDGDADAVHAALVANGQAPLAVFNAVLRRHVVNHAAPLRADAPPAGARRPHWHYRLDDVPPIGARRPRGSTAPGGDMHVDYVAPDIVGPLTLLEAARILQMQTQRASRRRSSLLCTANAHTISVHCWADPAGGAGAGGSGGGEQYLLIDTGGPGAFSTMRHAASTADAADMLAEHYGRRNVVINARFVSVR